MNLNTNNFNDPGIDQDLQGDFPHLLLTKITTELDTFIIRVYILCLQVIFMAIHFNKSSAESSQVVMHVFTAQINSMHDFNEVKEDYSLLSTAKTTAD